MDYGSVADRYEFFAGSFTLDFYTQALRRFIKQSVLKGEIGHLEDNPIDPHFSNLRPLGLLLGESNRLKIRYPLIAELLQEYKAGKLSSSTELRQTKYFDYLYSNFKTRSYIQRCVGKKSCTEKTERVLRIYDWLERNNGDLSGLTSFIAGANNSDDAKDYPLAIRLDTANNLQSFVQLDGSHRRSVASFLGCRNIRSNVVSLDSLEEYVGRCDDKYISGHWPIFVGFAKSLNLYEFSNAK